MYWKYFHNKWLKLFLCSDQFNSHFLSSYTASPRENSPSFPPSTPAYGFVVVQLLSCVQHFVTPWTAAHQASLSFTVSQSLLRLMSFELVMPSNHLILCCSLLPCLHSFPVSGSFPVSQFLASGGQSFGASASSSVLPVNIQGWFPLGLIGLISLLPRELSEVFSSATVQMHQFLVLSAFFIFQLSHPYMTTGKTIALTVRTFIGKVMSFLLNTLTRFIISFLPRSKHLLISWLQSPSEVILEPKKMVCHRLHCFPIYLPWSDGIGCHDPRFLNVEFFSLSYFTFIKKLCNSSLLSSIRVVSSAYLRLLIFLLAVLIPACASSSPAFRMVYFAYKLNKQGDNIQPWRTHFPIWNQSVVPCPVLTVTSWPAYRFHRRQVGGLVFLSLKEFSTVCCDRHSQRLYHSQWSRSRCFSGIH